jgi:hypothetical protein
LVSTLSPVNPTHLRSTCRIPLAGFRCRLDKSRDGTACADSDTTERDEADAIDKSNILKGDRLRHAKPTNTYREPGDEEGLPKGNDGTSAARAPGAEGAYDNVIGGGEGTGIEGNAL